MFGGVIAAAVERPFVVSEPPADDDPDTEAEDGDGPIAVDEEPDEAGAGIALPAPFGSDGDGPPPLVGAAVLMALGFAIMTLIVLLVRYVRGSWNP